MFKRKRLLINPRFQLRVMLFGGLIGAICLGIVYFTHGYFFNEYRSAMEGMGFPDEHPVFLLLKNQEARLQWLFLISLAAGLSASCGIGLILSHRIAGPIYRMCEHLNAIARGEKPPGPVKFREGDYFRELSEAYNRSLTPGRDHETS